jgi:hypothetical protein
MERAHELPPRYAAAPLPAYRYFPGRSPHPLRDPAGHSFARTEPEPSPLDARCWRESESYRFGIDLYNLGYWWECHDALEPVWKSLSHDRMASDFVQGLIQIAASHWTAQLGRSRASRSLAARGTAHLEAVTAPIFMGVEIHPFVREVRRCAEQGDPPPPIHLRFEDPG